MAELNTLAWPASLEPTCYVCGPTGFVETAADILVALGHEPRRVTHRALRPQRPLNLFYTAGPGGRTTKEWA